MSVLSIVSSTLRHMALLFTALILVFCLLWMFQEWRRDGLPVDPWLLAGVGVMRDTLGAYSLTSPTGG